MHAFTRSRGRPLGKDYGLVKSIRLTHADADLLRFLAKEWGCSEAAAVRRLVREKAGRVKKLDTGGEAVTS